MNAVLPSDKAREICLKWMENLSENSPENGCMLGVLVCTDGTVLKAFSGLNKTLMENTEYAPPCFEKAVFEKNSSNWDALLDTYRFHCIDHSIRTLREIFPDAPSGAGTAVHRAFCAAVLNLVRSLFPWPNSSGVIHLLSVGHSTTPVTAAANPCSNTSSAWTLSTQMRTLLL